MAQGVEAAAANPFDGVIPAVKEVDETPYLMPRRPHRKSLLQWIPSDDEQLEQVETAILRHLNVPYRASDACGIHSISTDCASVSSRRDQYAVKPGKLACDPLSAESELFHDHIVLLHGFGGGLATWMPNYGSLVHRFAGRRVTLHAIDLPGFARSRREWAHIADENEAIGYLVERVKRWLDARCVPASATDACVPAGAEVATCTPPTRITLVGHSFGGYVSAHVAMNYPGFIHKLVLVDPWGVPLMTENDKPKNMPLKWRCAMRLFYAMLPFALLRAAGPMGPGFLPKVRKDFADRWQPHLVDVNLFYDYVYHCNANKDAVGELAFQKCCHGPAYAKRPLEQELARRLPADCHLAVIYGIHTWMNRRAGRALYESVPTAGTDRRKHFYLVSDAGHQVTSDNAAEFNLRLLDVLLAEESPVPRDPNDGLTPSST